MEHDERVNRIYKINEQLGIITEDTIERKKLVDEITREIILLFQEDYARLTPRDTEKLFNLQEGTLG